METLQALLIFPTIGQELAPDLRILIGAVAVASSGPSLGHSG